MMITIQEKPDAKILKVPATIRGLMHTRFTNKAATDGLLRRGFNIFIRARFLSDIHCGGHRPHVEGLRDAWDDCGMRGGCSIYRDEKRGYREVIDKNASLGGSRPKRPVEKSLKEDFSTTFNALFSRFRYTDIYCQ